MTSPRVSCDRWQAAGARGQRRDQRRRAEADGRSSLREPDLSDSGHNICEGRIPDVANTVSCARGFSPRKSENLSHLLAHVVENLEAGLERPHGCGEQTISSTYPSLLVT